MPNVLSDNDALSIREVAELFDVTRHKVVVSLAFAGVIPRKVAQTYAIRREDLDLLRPLLMKEADESVPAA